MFDSIILNMITSGARSSLAALALYFVKIGVMPTSGEDNFVAAGLVFVNLAWAWYEKYGHAALSDAAKQAGVKVAAVLICFFVFAPDIAHAQTKSVAASAPTTCTLAYCVGPYVSAGIGGVGSNMDILGAGIQGSVFAGGGLPFAGAGYLYWNGTTLFGIEVGGGDQFSTNASVQGVGGNQNGWLTYEIAELGGNLSQIFTGQAAITPPSNLLQYLMSLYAFAGEAQRSFGSGWVVGGGGKFLIAKNLLFDIKYMDINYNGGTTNGAASFSNESLVLAGINYKF